MKQHRGAALLGSIGLAWGVASCGVDGGTSTSFGGSMPIELTVTETSSSSGVGETSSSTGETTTSSPTSSGSGSSSGSSGSAGCVDDLNYLKVLETNNFTKVSIAEIITFVREKLQLPLQVDFEMFQTEFQITSLYNQLNKPIRVCGMVKNEGEPGGGPFWVNDKGKISLQIVETSQIDLKNENQIEIVKNATHFNPVDLVCVIKDYKGNKFNLSLFIDENTGFIVEKNKNGKPSKSL